MVTYAEFLTILAGWFSTQLPGQTSVKINMTTLINIVTRSHKSTYVLKINYTEMIMTLAGISWLGGHKASFT